MRHDDTYRTSDEIEFIASFKNDKRRLFKYYRAALRRQDWGIINKHVVLRFVKMELYKTYCG